MSSARYVLWPQVVVVVYANTQGGDSSGPSPRATRKVVTENGATELAHLLACFSFCRVPSEAGRGWRHGRDACRHVRDAFRPGVPRTL